MPYVNLLKNLLQNKMEEPSTSKAEHLDESQFVDEKIKVSFKLDIRMRLHLQISLPFQNLSPLVIGGGTCYKHGCQWLRLS